MSKPVDYDYPILTSKREMDRYAGKCVEIIVEKMSKALQESGADVTMLSYTNPWKEKAES